ncbi:uncharacterized protein [Ptychodera flava]|uniref:uncharacterized protein n=1 Tax=Ptychodera flava TaxID=63121 RepID=UPI00396A4362
MVGVFCIYPQYNLNNQQPVSGTDISTKTVVSGTSPSVRLVGGETPYDGRVEAFLAGSGWSPVLRSSWGATDASIVCNELGYHGFRWWSWQDNALVDDTRLRLVNVRCIGNETSIVRCAYKTTLSYQTAATVACNYESYVGCYNNDRNDPIFSNHIKYSRWMTIQKCLEYCYSHNMTYAGIVNGNRCYCGDRDSDYGRFGRVSDEMCTARCRGDYNQICGGIDEASIYLASMGSCGGHVNGSGTIFSPGFPGTLPRTIGNCTWIVTSPLEQG